MESQLSRWPSSRGSRLRRLRHSRFHTIKPSSPTANSMTFRFAGPRRFTANNHTLKECVAFAYTLSLPLIIGGPPWIDSDRYDIVGEIAGETRPPLEQVLVMFQGLLADRFQLKFHREPQERPVYNLVLAKTELKVKENTGGPGQPPALMYGPAGPRALRLPARNTTMPAFAALMQRTILDRPVIDKTGLTGRYDFDLEWRIDGTQMDRGPAPAGFESDKPDIFTALRELGLRLEPSRGQVEVLVIDHVAKPDEN